MISKLPRRKGLLLFAVLLLGSSVSGCSQKRTPPPPPPTGLVASPGDGYVTLSWTAAPRATSYNVYWSINPGIAETTAIAATKILSTAMFHAPATNGTTYYYAVAAVGKGGVSALSSEVSATPVAATAVVDPLYADQWHLKITSGEDINAEAAWAQDCPGPIKCKGDSVRIAIVDDGLEIAHEDLGPNVASGKSYNYLTGGSDPTSGDHGTNVAGVAAARDDNGIGVRGAAPRANMVGYNLLQRFTTANQVDAMTRDTDNVAVSSNSWGPNDDTGHLDAAPAAWQSAVAAGLTGGRGGKGTVYVWAAGNGYWSPTITNTQGITYDCLSSCLDNSNYDGYANNRGVIAVAAVTSAGVKADYSELGANLWVSAPAGNFCDTSGPTITTTDRTGAAGANNTGTNIYYPGFIDYPDSNYTKCFNGTSAATPIVSGVVAMMLQANPALTWRDVRMILAQTARQNDATDGTWSTNGAGYHHSHKYGFGVVDAGAAVTAAKTWPNVGSEVTCTSAVQTVNVAIPPGTGTPGYGAALTPTPSIDMSACAITQIEWVEVTFTATHPYSGDLKVVLTAPTGTQSVLAEQHYCAGACSAYANWVFGSARHLGESPAGNWTLSVRDGYTTDSGTFNAWSIKLYGH